jgi:glucose-1-phosphate adenylyltransferase
MQTNDEKYLSEKVASVVLAGGQGTRLHPLTLHRCKPGVAFGGRYRLIDIPISNSLNSRINRIFVISQYFASSLQQHLAATYHYDSLKPGNLEMLCPEETAQGVNWFKGTADAVRKNLEYLNRSEVEYYLILSGDQLYNIDFIDMIDFAKKNDADLVIACLPVEKKEATRMGLLKIDESQHVVDFHEKPSDPKILERFEYHCKNTSTLDRCPPSQTRYLGSMGIYVFKKQALIDLLKQPGDDFGKELIPYKVKQGNAYGYIYDGYWEDIGTVSSYYLANLALTEQKNCLNTYDETHPIYAETQHVPSSIIRDTLIKNSVISQGCMIEAQEISHSLIGIRSFIKKGSVIRDSVIIGNHSCNPMEKSLSPFSIGENCLIQKAIIDEQTYIGNQVELVNKKNLATYDGDGIYIRDGIIIVTSGTRVPDGFSF